MEIGSDQGVLGLSENGLCQSSNYGLGTITDTF